MARVMQFPSAFPQGTGQEQGAQARAQAQLMQGSILGNLMKDLSQVATGAMQARQVEAQEQKKEEQAKLLLGILEPILTQGSTPQPAQAYSLDRTELPSYARGHIPQLGMPAEAMGLDVSSMNPGQAAISALIEASKDDPSIMQNPLAQSIIKFGMAPPPDPVFRDLGEEVGVFNARTGKVMHTVPKTRAEKEGNQKVKWVEGQRNGEKVQIGYDEDTWEEVSVLHTGVPAEADRAPVQWRENLKVRQNYFKEAAAGGVYVHMGTHFYTGAPQRKEIVIENEGRLRELMSWQNVDPESPEGQEILELYRSSGKLLVQEGLTDTDESQQHTEKQREWWDIWGKGMDKLFGSGGGKDEEVKVIRGEGKKERSAEDAVSGVKEARGETPGEAPAEASPELGPRATETKMKIEEYHQDLQDRVHAFMTAGGTKKQVDEWMARNGYPPIMWSEE
jgi:hypothetical protein